MEREVGETLKETKWKHLAEKSKVKSRSSESMQASTHVNETRVDRVNEGLRDNTILL